MSQDLVNATLRSHGCGETAQFGLCGDVCHAAFRAAVIGWILRSDFYPDVPSMTKPLRAAITSHGQDEYSHLDTLRSFRVGVG